jgi:hypothetical protein
MAELSIPTRTAITGQLQRSSNLTPVLIPPGLGSFIIRSRRATTDYTSRNEIDL